MHYLNNIFKSSKNTEWKRIPRDRLKKALFWIPYSKVLSQKDSNALIRFHMQNVRVLRVQSLLVHDLILTWILNFQVVYILKSIYTHCARFWGVVIRYDYLRTHQFDCHGAHQSRTSKILPSLERSLSEWEDIEAHWRLLLYQSSLKFRESLIEPVQRRPICSYFQVHQLRGR